MPEVFELEIMPVDESDAGWLSEDSIEFGSAPRDWSMQFPNWLDPLLSRVPTKLILALFGLGLVVAIAISATHPNQPVALPTPAPAVPTTALDDPEHTTLNAMVATAESPDQLHDFDIVDNVHPDCPEALAQPNPAAAIAGAVVRYQPDYALRDAGVGSEITGICSAQLRFTDPNGATLIVTVLAPPNTVTPFTVTSTTPTMDAIDVVVNIASWRIEVGGIGPPGTTLDELQLVAIATDARLRWA